MPGILIAETSFAQQWQWTRDDYVLNPSGIGYQTNTAQFQTLDWNDDGALEYYEQATDDSLRWQKRELNLPMIGLTAAMHGSYGLPKKFQFIDWDKDGDFDLTADSSKFWWNTGSNANPVWRPGSGRGQCRRPAALLHK